LFWTVFGDVVACVDSVADVVGCCEVIALDDVAVYIN